MSDVPSDLDLKRLLNIDETADIVHIHRQTLWEIAAGRRKGDAPPHVELNNRYFFRPASVDAWLKEREKVAAVARAARLAARMAAIPGTPATDTVTAVPQPRKTRPRLSDSKVGKR